jgi:hypothetical protein
MTPERRKIHEATETAETLVEDRGATNALAWAEHCAIRDQSGFWPMVAAMIKVTARQALNADNQLKHFRG